MDHTYSRAALFKFLDTLGSQGLANANTAQSIRVACGKILIDLSDAEEADVRKIDVGLAVRKFHNKNPGVLSPSSLAEYQRRVGLAIREFDLYQGDPARYRGFGRNPGRAENGEKPTTKKKDQALSTGARTEAEIRPASAPAVTTHGLSHAFPLRPDFLAQLVLPRDLKTSEAQRLAAFIRALASDFSPTE